MTNKQTNKRKRFQEIAKEEHRDAWTNILLFT